MFEPDDETSLGHTRRRSIRAQAPDATPAGTCEFSPDANAIARCACGARPDLSAGDTAQRAPVPRSHTRPGQCLPGFSAAPYATARGCDCRCGALQDWSSDEVMRGPIDESVQLGCTPGFRTNRNLIALLQRTFGLRLQTVAAHQRGEAAVAFSSFMVIARQRSILAIARDDSNTAAPHSRAIRSSRLQTSTQRSMASARSRTCADITASSFRGTGTCSNRGRTSVEKSLALSAHVTRHSRARSEHEHPCRADVRRRLWRIPSLR